MAIQNLPAFWDMVFTNKEGHLSADGYLYSDQTFQALNLSVSDLNAVTSTYVQNGTVNPYGLSPIPANGELVVIGLNPPSFTTAQINAIAAASPQVVPFGTIWYNTTINKLQVYINIAPAPPGYAVQTITST